MGPGPVGLGPNEWAQWARAQMNLPEWGQKGPGPGPNEWIQWARAQDPNEWAQWARGPNEWALTIRKIPWEGKSAIQVLFSPLRLKLDNELYIR